MIFKLKMLVDFGEGNEFTDIWFDGNEIDGFFVGQPTDDGQPTIQIFFNGDMATILQEDHIVEYLKKAFVNRAVVTK